MRAFFVATSVALALFAVFWYTFGGHNYFGNDGSSPEIVAAILNKGGPEKRSPEAAPAAAPRTAPPREFAALTGDHSPPAATVFPVIPKAPPKPPAYAKLTGDHSPPSPTVFPVVPEAPVVAQTFAKLTGDHSPPAPTVVPNTPSLLPDGSADLTPPRGTVFPVKFSLLPDAAPLKFAALTGDHSPPPATVSPMVPEADSATPGYGRAGPR